MTTVNENAGAPPHGDDPGGPTPDPPNEVDREIARLTRALVFWTRVMGGAAAVAVIISLAQCIEMKGQLAEMKASGEQTNRAIAESHRLADLAADANGESQRHSDETNGRTDQTLTISRTQAFADRRAWVGPVAAQVFDLDKATPSVSVNYINFGREPATRTVNSGVALEIPRVLLENPVNAMKVDAVDRRACGHHPPGKPGFVVYPGAMTPGTTYMLTPTVRVSNAANIRSGLGLLLVTGCFAYVYEGHTHHSGFCFYYDAKLTPSPFLRWCQVGNFSD